MSQKYEEAATGATPYAVEPHAGRVALAEELGARRADLEGRRYPYVFETGGPPAAFATALRSAARTAP